MTALSRTDLLLGLTERKSPLRRRLPQTMMLSCGSSNFRLTLGDPEQSCEGPDDHTVI
jgi:hypothetical protein